MWHLDAPTYRLAIVFFITFANLSVILFERRLYFLSFIHCLIFKFIDMTVFLLI